MARCNTEEYEMAVPKSKITRSKRNMRRAHDAITNDSYIEDKVTGELHRRSSRRVAGRKVFASLSCTPGCTLLRCSRQPKPTTGA